MMSSEFKLVCDSRFWAELSFAYKSLKFRSSRFPLDFVEGGLLFDFQRRKNRKKIAQIHNPKGVLAKSTPLNPMSMSVFSNETLERFFILIMSATNGFLP